MVKDSPAVNPSAREERGLRCPKCGCGHLPVRYTRQQNGHIMRVRRCRHCGHRVVTRERP
jgi:DNA-directed RNA polymerase subunit RPC12/RpoP